MSEGRRRSSDSEACHVPNAEKRPRRGEWWSIEVGAPVELGTDFVPDTQDGGGDEFIFFPDQDSATPNNSLATVSEGDVFDAAAASVQGGDEIRDEGLMRAHEQVQRLRRLFPPIPSLVDELRNHLTSMGRKDDKLLLRCGIKPLTHPTRHEAITNIDEVADAELLLDDDSQATVDNESSQLLLSPSSSSWSGTMFKSMSPYGPCSPPSPADAAISGAGMLRSRKPAPASGPATAGRRSAKRRTRQTLVWWHSALNCRVHVLTKCMPAPDSGFCVPGGASSPRIVCLSRISMALRPVMIRDGFHGALSDGFFEIWPSTSATL